MPAMTEEQLRQARDESLAGAAELATELGDLRHYCMFIGYPRSGHSLVGALLDAHPDAIIAHELDALSYLQAGFKAEQIHYLLLANSRQYASNERQWGEFKYAVPNQWNGRYRQLQVIGDKKGGRTTRQLAKHPKLLDRLHKTLGLPLRLIHVTRNPFDNIATMAKRGKAPGLAHAAKVYLGLVEVVHRIRTKLPRDMWLDVRHEDLISDAIPVLQRLCGFLGLVCTEDYLRDCAGIVYAKPHRSRHETDWPADLRRDIEGRIARYDFLRDYRFDEP